MSFIIRKGTKEDVPGMMQLVHELAAFERAPQEVVNTPQMMLEDGFGNEPIYRVVVAEEADTNRIIGMALFYTAYSTWKGRILFLDDLIVTESYRRYGIGRKLIHEFLKQAKEDSVTQVRWQVLDWNTPAIEFYKSLGAALDAEWITCKMTDSQIKQYLNTIK